MARLTDTQLIVLSKAAAREDGIAMVPDRLNKAAAAKVVASLVSRKLMREVRSKPGMPAWRDDDEGRGTSLVITQGGRQAIGIEDEENQCSQQTPAGDEAGVQPRRPSARKRPPPPPGKHRGTTSRLEASTYHQLSHEEVRRDVGNDDRGDRLAAAYHAGGADRTSQVRLRRAARTAGRQAITVSHRFGAGPGGGLIDERGKQEAPAGATAG